MSNELAQRNNGTALDLLSGSRDDIFRLGETLFQSGYFKDIKSGAQAIVKILRGAELGMGPIQSLENVYVVEGRTALSYPAIGAQIKKSVRYDYRVLTSSDTECEIAFFEQGKELGRTQFTLKDAERAQLLGKDNWKKYPKAMLFARALSAGARQYTPDVFGGTIYSVDELRDITAPELAIDTPVQTVDQTTGEITEPPVKKLKRPPTREAALVGGWQMLQQQGRELGVDVPDIDLGLTDQQLGAAHAEWVERIRERALAQAGDDEEVAASTPTA